MYQPILFDLKNELTLFWFRRDLRLEDNNGLFRALSENKSVLPIFIFDKHILEKLEEKADRRVDFIHQAVDLLKSQLQALGSDLLVFNDAPLQVLENLTRDHNLKNVYANHDYEPYARKRDRDIEEFLSSKNLPFYTYKDQCVFEKSEITKDNDLPYTIFTPYSRKWKSKLSPGHYSAYPTTAFFKNFFKASPKPMPNLESLGFKKTDILLNKDKNVSEELLRKYKEQRDFPSIAGTSKLSVYLRFGIISVRSLVAKALPLSETWLNELIWRDFYMMILWHFPYVSESSFKPLYDRVVWRNKESEFEKWCTGTTGFPIVDAGMRELNSTGFMHNRVRMIVSSFLVKDLLIDWRWGEAYFAQKLNDFDLSANNGGWQWAAGCGCDAAPYFRIFNPTEQQKKFDPQFTYIKTWVPEFGTTKYPAPIVDHAQARLRTLATYKSALNESKQVALF